MIYNKKIYYLNIIKYKYNNEMRKSQSQLRWANRNQTENKYKKWLSFLNNQNGFHFKKSRSAPYICIRAKVAAGPYYSLFACYLT